MSCVGCGSTTLAETTRALGYQPAKPEFFIHRCGCGLGWTHPSVSDKEIGRWYPPAYYGKENVRFNPVFEWLVRLFRKRRAAVVLRRARPGPVLDVGCGRGLTLHFLRSVGFEPHGVELNESAAWHARSRLGIDVHVGDFLDSPFKAGQFHSIIFWHSLEHFRKPKEALEHAHKLLKPGGLLVVAVPNSDSFQAKLFGAHWFHLDVPRHYFHFDTPSLTRMLEREGFEIVQTDHFSFEQNPYGWLQSVYNAMGLEFNFLYSLLKNKTSRVVPVRKHPLQALWTLATLPILLPLSILMTFVEAGLRKGGTVEAYAVKR